jgi:hypothetical protein
MLTGGGGGYSPLPVSLVSRYDPRRPLAAHSYRFAPPPRPEHLLVIRTLEAGLRIRIHMIRIQHFRLNTDPDQDQIRIQGFDDQILQKIYTKKYNFFFKNYNLPIPRPL